MAVYSLAMKVYEGFRTEVGCAVTADGRPLNIRMDLRKHSDRPEWGYPGGGPAQLALALLADAVGEEAAMAYHQKFKFQVVAGFEHHGWILTQAEIRCWVADLLSRKGTPPDDRPQE